MLKLPNKTTTDLEEICRTRFLWILNLSNNMLDNISALSCYPVIGYLNLSSNHLTWANLETIKHIFVIDLELWGNKELEKDEFYRYQIVDGFQKTFCLDRIFITAQERTQVDLFFNISSLNKLSIRRRLKKNSFRPSKLRYLRQSTNNINEKSFQFLVQFPDEIPMIDEWDIKKLYFLLDYTKDFLDSQNHVILEEIRILMDNLKTNKNLFQLSYLIVGLTGQMEFGLTDEFAKVFVDNCTNESNRHQLIQLFCTLNMDQKLLVLRILIGAFIVFKSFHRIKDNLLHREIQKSITNIFWIKRRHLAVDNITQVFQMYRDRRTNTFHTYWASRCILASEMFLQMYKSETEPDLYKEDMSKLVNCATGYSTINISNEESVIPEYDFTEHKSHDILQKIGAYIEEITASSEIESLLGGPPFMKSKRSTVKTVARIQAHTDHLLLDIHRGFQGQHTKEVNNADQGRRSMDIGDYVILGSQMLVKVIARPSKYNVVVQTMKEPRMRVKSSNIQSSGKYMNIQSIIPSKFNWDSSNNIWIPNSCTGDSIFLYQAPTSSSYDPSLLTKKMTSSSISVCSDWITQNQHEFTPVLPDHAIESIPADVKEQPSKITRSNTAVSCTKSLITPKPAILLFSDTKDITRAKSSNYSFSRSSMTHIPKEYESLNPDSSRISIKNCGKWLANGEVINRDIWWSSTNPRNRTKKVYTPGWLT